VGTSRTGWRARRLTTALTTLGLVAAPSVLGIGLEQPAIAGEGSGHGYDAARTRHQLDTLDDPLPLLRVPAPNASHAEADATAGAVLRALQHRLSGRVATSAPSLAAAPTSAPTILSPAQGSTVGGIVELSAQSSAAKVRFTVSGTGIVRDAPVTAGTATASLDSFGLRGPQTVVAVDCDEPSQCAGTGDAVEVTIANAPLVLSSPTDGQTVGTSFMASAEPAGPAVRFSFDGAVVGTSQQPPHQVTIDTSLVAEGPHLVTAVTCDAELVSCDGEAAQATVVVVNQLRPRLVSVSPDPFSPNGDGRKDSATVTYRLDRAQRVTWSVLRDGAVVRGPVSIGTRQEGTHRFELDGRDDAGRRLGTGGYMLRLTTSANLDGSPVTGLAEAAFAIDVTAPRADRLKASPATVFPVRDSYRDTTTISARLREGGVEAQVQILDSRGRKVRSLRVPGRRGDVAVTWNGRRAKGDLVPEGTYRYRIVVTDPAGNRFTSDARTLRVSHKRLVERTTTRTLLPRSSAVAALIGDCSAIGTPARRGWPKSLAYLSNYYVCFNPSDVDLLAVTRHAVTLPKAFRPGTIRVDTYGARTVPGFPDRGVVLYERRNGDISAKGALLRPAERWHVGDRVPAERFVNKQQRFRWWAGTTNGYWYSVRSFRVTYRYEVLR
jgi:flagellar hook assembly protein FlgD